ncbi:MAG: hypothetical protein WCI73_16965, partial [Phycisphaerae bacterium]
MKTWILLAAMSATFIGAALRGAAPTLTAPATSPAPVDTAMDLARKYDAYVRPLRDIKFVPTQKISTTQPADAKAWKVIDGQATCTDEGLRLQADDRCYATLDHKLTGPVGIRYEARSEPDRPACDLSVRMIYGTAQATLQFGAHYNTENLLAQSGANEMSNLGGNLITPGKWHTVECSIGPNGIRGVIDGRTIVTTPLQSPLDEKTPVQIAFYVFQSTGTFRSVELGQHVPIDEVKRDWKDIFGQVTEDQLKQIAVAAAPHLGDDDYKTRKRADDLLLLLRPLSNEAILEALKSPDPEAKSRATRLAAKAGLLTRTTQPGPQVIPA